MKISSILSGFLFSFFFLVLWSCAEEVSVSDTLQKAMSDEIDISATIHSFTSGTRAQLDEKGKGAFEEGDRISFFSASKQYPWQNDVLTFDKGQWKSCPSWNKVGRVGDNVDFTAYYPTLTSQGKETLFSVFADQSTAANYTGSDLLGAKASVRIPESVSLHFQHLMSHVTISLYSEDKSFNEEQLDNATIEIRSCLGGTVLLGENKTGGVDGTSVQLIKTYKHGKVFSAILFPQPLSLFRDANGWIRITIGGKSVVYKAPEELNGEKLERLRSGSQLTLRLNLQKKQGEPADVLPDVANVTLWVYGVNIPSTHDWANDRLSWNIHYGWFDCNKTYPGRGGSDSNLCWAASASNLIHWFLKHNEENIRHYEAVSNKSFKGPRGFRAPTDSDVFNWFKQRHSNKGGHIGNGVNEYMLGVYISPGTPYKGNDIDTVNAGFLYDITGGVNLVEAINNKDRRAGLGKQLFNCQMKEALTGRKAIGFSIRQSGLSAGHAMTIWGADLDVSGDVSAVYIVDNNDTPYGGMLWKKRIIYKNNLTYLESSAIGYSDPIVSLIFLELGDRLWKDYFKKHDSFEK